MNTQKGNVGVIILVVIVLVLLGVGVYYYFSVFRPCQLGTKGEGEVCSDSGECKNGYCYVSDIDSRLTKEQREKVGQFIKPSKEGSLKINGYCGRAAGCIFEVRDGEISYKSFQMCIDF